MKTILFSIILFSIICVSCDPCKRLAKQCPPLIKDSLTYVEVVTENPNYTIPDSLFWQMSFECDSAYSVLMSELIESNTGLNADVQVKEVVKYIKDEKQINKFVLTIRVSSDSIRTLNKTIEKLKNTVKTITIEKEVPVYKCRKFFIYCTIAFFVCVVLTIGWMYLKYKAKILSLFK